METQSKSTLGRVAKFLNAAHQTPSGSELDLLRELCLDYGNGEGKAQAAINRVLKAHPVLMVVASTDVYNNGTPFFTYRPAISAQRQDVTPETIAELQFPGLLIDLLTAMQQRKLHLLRRCDECGQWTEAKRKDQRFCAPPAKCKRRWFEGSPKYKAQAAARQRKLYKARKDRDNRVKVAAQVSK
jgi:hypothetical protein